MAQAGNSMSETTALITAGSEIMTGQSSRVARGLRSITLNLQGMDDSGNEVLNLLPKMEEDFKKIGITLKGSDGQMKSTFDILSEMSEKYNTLDQNTKNYYSALVGGKTQVDVVNSILSNFTTAVGANEAAINSAGSATKENAKYLDSVEGKISKLTSSLQKLATDALQSGTVKGFLDAATAMIKFIDSVGGVQTVLIAITASLVIFKKELIASSLISFATNGIGALKTGFIVLTSLISEASAAIALFDGSVIASELILTAFLPIVALIGVGIYAGVKAYDALNITMEEQAKIVENTKKQYDETISSLKNVNEQLEKKRKKLQELENIQNPTLTDEKDKINLEKEVSLLEQKSAFLKEQSEIQKEKKQSETIGLLKKTEKVKTGETYSGEYGLSEVTDNVGKIDKISLEIERYNKETEKANSLTKNWGESEDQFQKRQQASKDALLATKGSINATALELLGLKENLDENSFAGVEYIGMINTAVDAASKFLGTTKEQASTTEDATAKLEAYNKSLTSANSALAEDKGSLSETIDSMKNFADNMDILTSAQDELSASGTLTADTFKSLMDNNLIQYLEVVNGQLSINTQGFLNSADALKAKATQTAQATLYDQIHAIVMEQLVAQNQAVKTTSDDAGSSIMTAAQKADAANTSFLNAAAGATAFATGLDQIATGGKGTFSATDETMAKINSAIANTKKTISAISAINISAGSGKKKSSTSTKTVKEEYKATVDALHAYKEAIKNTQNEVEKVSDYKGLTENYDEQIKYINQLIALKEKEKNQIGDLQREQSKQIQSNIAQLRAQGFQIDYNNASNELYINNLGLLTSKSGDNAKALEKLIKETQSLNSDNADLSNNYRDLTKDVQDYYTELAEFPEKKLEKFKELMSEFQKSQLQSISDQITDLQHAMDSDERLKTLNAQIDALKEQSDEVDKQAELQDKLLNIEKAKIALENAQKQKNIQVYRAGQGFVYEADTSVIQSAKEDLKSAQDELDSYLSDERISALEDERDAIEKNYQDKIDLLQDFADEQQYIIDKAGRGTIETFSELSSQLAKFGLDNQTYLSQAATWLDNYNKALTNLNTTSISTGNQTLYSSGTGTTGSLLNNVSYESLLGQITKTAVGYTGKGTGSTTIINIDNIELPNVTDSDSFLSALDSLPDMASARASTRK